MAMLSIDHRFFIGVQNLFCSSRFSFQIYFASAQNFARKLKIRLLGIFMQALRKIHQITSNTLTIPVPEAFQNCRVENFIHSK